MTRVLGVDAGSPSLREADHLIADLAVRLGLPGDALACSHLVRTGDPHVAISLTVPHEVDLSPLPAHAVTALVPSRPRAATPVLTGGPSAGGPPDGRVAGAELAVAEHGRSGRAVRFAGVDRLTGRLTVGEVLALSAIERVEVLMGGEPSADTVLDTRDHVRPEWRNGVLTLLALPAGAGVIAPYEVPNPTPCCADHG